MIRPGRNIAIKVPLHRWDETVAFYRDRVALPVTRVLENSVGFDFNGSSCGSTASRTSPRPMSGWNCSAMTPDRR
jgi:hypothetical protein